MEYNLQHESGEIFVFKKQEISFFKIKSNKKAIVLYFKNRLSIFEIQINDLEDAKVFSKSFFNKKNSVLITNQVKYILTNQADLTNHLTMTIN